MNEQDNNTKELNGRGNRRVLSTLHIPDRNGDGWMNGMDGMNGMRWDGVDITLARWMDGWVDGWMDKPNYRVNYRESNQDQSSRESSAWMLFFLLAVCVLWWRYSVLSLYVPYQKMKNGTKVDSRIMDQFHPPKGRRSCLGLVVFQTSISAN